MANEKELEALIAKWRESATNDDNRQYAQALDQCADELEAAARAARPPELLTELHTALRERSEQFHDAERIRTATFRGGQHQGRWDTCDGHPCTADRKLLAGEAPRPVSAPAQEEFTSEQLAALRVEYDDWLTARNAARAPAWQPIETAPENQSILIYLPNCEHYGPGIYRAILVNMGTGRHWLTTGWSVGRDLQPGYPQPTHWMPLPAPPTASVVYPRPVSAPAFMEGQAYMRERIADVVRGEHPEIAALVEKLPLLGAPSPEAQMEATLREAVRVTKPLRDREVAAEQVTSDLLNMRLDTAQPVPAPAQKDTKTLYAELADACAVVLAPEPVDDETCVRNFQRIRDLARELMEPRPVSETPASITKDQDHEE